ncbi:hypothetical protein YC2023_004898 [Brassica napus]|uniref:Uncharacterized protein n=1 Tax=Brassica campestris TaxID=3711 RepID=A0A3P5ZPV6_BRACM|nr:unnamed protein product [Brassica rapa]
MANSCTVLADLRAGRCSNVEEVRLLRFCEAKNINKRGQLMSLEMLLIDEHSTLVQGSVPASLQLTFRGRLTEGSVYTLSGFDVTRSNPKLRIKKSCHNEEAEPPCKLSSSIYYGGQEKNSFTTTTTIDTVSRSRTYHTHNTYVGNLTKLIFFSLHVCVVPICISSLKILRFFFIFNLCSTREMERKAIPKAHHEETGEKVSLFSYPNFKIYLVTRFVLPHCAEFISFLCNKNYIW